MNDNYTNTMIKQFGSIKVYADTPCKLCGERYGDHLGLTCPININNANKISPHLENELPRLIRNTK